MKRAGLEMEEALQVAAFRHDGPRWTVKIPTPDGTEPWPWYIEAASWTWLVAACAGFGLYWWLP